MDDATMNEAMSRAVGVITTRIHGDDASAWGIVQDCDTPAEFVALMGALAGIAVKLTRHAAERDGVPVEAWLDAFGRNVARHAP